MPASASPARASTETSTGSSTGATPPDYRVEALAKGLRVLSVFSEQRPTWRITDIAAEVSLPLPTAYRIVMTLTAEGYLDHLPSGEYRPGVRVLTLGTAALRSLDLVELATPKLQELANATRETVNLAVLTGDQVLYLVRLRNSDLVTANIRVGSLLPAVHTSIGKLLLAFLDEDELGRCVTGESFTGPTGPNAKRSLDELRPELAAIRAQGWATQDEELAYGLRSSSPATGRPPGSPASCGRWCSRPARRSRNCWATGASDPRGTTRQTSPAFPQRRPAAALCLDHERAERRRPGTVHAGR